MGIRIANDSDTEVIKNIWHECFGDTDPFLSWNFTRNYSAQNTLIYEENGIIVSNLQMTPYVVRLRGEEIKANYISGVATLPEFRNRGIVRELTREALYISRERGQDVSLLIPFNYGFYEKFGYKMCYKLIKHELQREQLPKFDASGGSAEFFDINNQNLKILNDIYKKFYVPFNGVIVRTDENFRLILEDVIDNFGGWCMAYRDKRGEYLAYALFNLDGNVLSVHEMAFASVEGYDGILQALKTMDINYEWIIITMPVLYGDMLNVLGGYKDYSRIYPFVMGRIIDVEKILRILCGKIQDVTYNIRIKIEDAFLEKNYVYEVNGNDVKIVDGKWDVKMDISIFSQLAFGAVSLKKIQFFGRIEGEIEKLNKIFEESENYANMLFS